MGTAMREGLPPTAAVVGLLLASACGCGPSLVSADAEQPWGPVVNGLQLSLTKAPDEFVQRHGLTPIFEGNSPEDGIYLLAFRNAGLLRMRLALGLDVNGEPDLSSVVLRVTDGTGHSLTETVGTRSFIGAFRSCFLPLAPGASYLAVVELHPTGRLFLARDHAKETEDVEHVRVFQFRAEYVAGNRVFLDHRGRNALHRDPVPSNAMSFTGAYLPLDHPEYEERKRPNALIEKRDLWEDYRP
jgi:hypothetical protein